MSDGMTVPGSVNWPPKVWLLMGHKLGDNAQIQALADALGWPHEIKRFVYKKTELITNRLLGCTLAGIIKDQSSPLGPPWPDLVISAGRRNEPVARWIQQQADRHVRLVHLGRPWARLERFDLIVTTPQYQLPERPNVLHNMVPLHRVTEDRLAEAASLWAPRLAHLPRPYVAVLIGGHSGAFTFDREAADHLGHAANAMAEKAGGSLVVTTSPRTPQSSIEALEATIDVPVYFFKWTPDAGENPYYGYLALADAFVVTADSMSMLTEACVTRKPVYIFDPSERRSSSGDIPDWWQRWRNFRFQNLVQWLSLRLAPRRMRRDVRTIHRRLVATGHAVWLGDEFPQDVSPAPLEDVQRAVERIRALFHSGAKAS